MCSETKLGGTSRGIERQINQMEQIDYSPLQREEGESASNRKAASRKGITDHVLIWLTILL